MMDGLLVGGGCNGLKFGTTAEVCAGNGNCGRVGDGYDEVCRDDGVDGKEDMEFCLLPGAGRVSLDVAGASCLILRGEPASKGDAAVPARAS